MLTSEQTLGQHVSAEQRAAAPVALLKTAPDRIVEDVHQAMELAKWKDYITPGADIALKPNLGWDKLIPGSISAPWVVEAVIIAIKDYVGKIYMVESDQVVVDAEKVIRLTKLDEVCRRHNVTWTNMSEGKFVRVQDPERLVLKDVNVPEILTRTELITLPVLKCHNKTTITGAIKNQWGCLETLRHNFHPVLPQALVDINTLVQPRFAVMDGTVGLEGNGPKSGIPKEMNLILASANLVGLDSVAAGVMGFDPHQIAHLCLCAENGLGSILDESTYGISIESVMTKFLHAEHNAVSRIELMLRKPVLEWLVFKTPILALMSWGARRYYDIWDWLIGEPLRSKFMSESPYADQWK